MLYSAQAHLQAVALGAGAAAQLIQECYGASITIARLPDQRGHVAQGHAWAILEFRGRQRVKVRGEQGAAVHSGAQVAKHSVCDGIPAQTRNR
jgi:hypothetical protein